MGLTVGLIGRQIIRRRLVGFDALMCSSNQQARYLAQMGYPPANIVSCPLFFDRDHLRGLQTVDGDYFVFYAQASMAKGWHLLADILESCPATKFVLAPPGDAAGSLERHRRLKRMIDGARVRLIGNIQWTSGLAQLVSGARGVIIPSVWPSTTEYVLLESLGLRKPVVVFDVGVHSEVLTHGVNAMIARVPSWVEFGKAVSSLDRDAGLRRSLGMGAQKVYDALTDGAAIVDALTNAIRTCERGS